MEDNKTPVNENQKAIEENAELTKAPFPPVDGKDGKCAPCTFPSDFVAEQCVKTYPITIDFCSDYKAFDIGDVYLDSLGRQLDLCLTLKRICPFKEVAVGLLLTELDFFGHEHKRGFKAIRYPGHVNGCHDVKINGIRFVLPEFLDKMGTGASICNQRKFIIRVSANYITTNVPPCQPKH